MAVTSSREGQDTTPPELREVRRLLKNQVRPSDQWSKSEAHAILKRIIPKGHLLEAKQIIQDFGMLDALRTKTLLKLYRHARRTGYVSYSADIAAEISRRTGEEEDIYRLEKTAADLQFLRDPWSLLPPLPRGIQQNPEGPVLHVVSKSYPETTTGYAVRTKHTAAALRHIGVRSVLVVPSGGNVGAEVQDTHERDEDGITTILMGGPSVKNTTRTEWLERNAHGLYQLVLRERPRVIHAHSDYVNGVLATHIGEATGIPVVYEVRGFWEESWLARLEANQGWDDTDEALSLYGTPDAYIFRRENEKKVRERVDHVITLARTMKNYILSESDPTRLSDSDVTVVPNAVVPEDFPLPAGPTSARAVHEIDPASITIGYISSITEYEGIDTLLQAFHELESNPLTPQVHLLIVGDGPRLGKLQEYAAELGLRRITFTGRIPHEEIRDYYHAIDIFVVPRRRTRVTELVTPLKPFEALSTGRTLVVSDLPALREIVDDAGQRAYTFPPGNSAALARLLLSLTKKRDELEPNNSIGPAWIRDARTWSGNASTCQRVYSLVT